MVGNVLEEGAFGDRLHRRGGVRNSMDGWACSPGERRVLDCRLVPHLCSSEAARLRNSCKLLPRTFTMMKGGVSRRRSCWCAGVGEQLADCGRRIRRRARRARLPSARAPAASCMQR